MLCFGLDSMKGKALELMFLFGFQLSQGKQGYIARSEVGKAIEKENQFVSFHECHLNGL